MLNRSSTLAVCLGALIGLALACACGADDAQVSSHGAAAKLGPSSTHSDSTQPRGAPPGLVNVDGQDLSPLLDGIRSPQFQVSNGPCADGSDPAVNPTCERALFEDYEAWSGMLMGNSMRDPFALSMLSVVNRFMVALMNADVNNKLIPPMADLDLPEVYRDKKGRLKPEDLLPITADLCLRCHTPPGWLEGRSEPATQLRPWLKGQFWAAAFEANPVDAQGNPRLVNPALESEAQLDGIQCGFCHRVKDNFKRTSNHPPYPRIPNGNGGYFLTAKNQVGHTVADIKALPDYAFVTSPTFCGTCHDVTNPIFKTRTKIAGAVPDALHPIERTFTEWYWSDFGQKGGATCQQCHQPMLFKGPQTWLIEPGFGALWGDVDQTWVNAPYNYLANTYPGKPGRSQFYQMARTRNTEFMQSAATVQLSSQLSKCKHKLQVEVVVTNNTGHKLPTGYPEGRQMWIHLTATDLATGKVIYESGALDGTGQLVRDRSTKVYECVAIAEGYDKFYTPDGFSILDVDRNHKVDHEEKEFHFILGNRIEKDNRIPPKGYVRSAYMADAAYIVPRDPQDSTYTEVPGQNWDRTRYVVPLAKPVAGPIRITATLKYQSFSRELVRFLKQQDKEKTKDFGGRMRPLPDGTFRDPQYKTWGSVAKALWKLGNKGEPAVIASDSVVLPAH